MLARQLANDLAAVIVLALAVGTGQAGYTATLGRYPGYAGRFSAFAGAVELGGPHTQKMARAGRPNEQWYDMAYTLTGADSTGGLHIHTGTSCDDAAAVGGHFWVDERGTSECVLDPWPSTVYNRSAGVLQFHCIPALAGLVGRAVVAHDSAGVRIGCGIIVEDDARAVPSGISLDLIGLELFETGYILPAGLGALGGLSALTHDAAGRWWVLSDRGSVYYEITLDIDALLHRQRFVSFGTGGVVGGAAPIGERTQALDAEGLAACRFEGMLRSSTTAELYVSTEDPSRVFAFSAASGVAVDPSTSPFLVPELDMGQTPVSTASVARNKQLESLTCGNGMLITANEGPLRGDGPPASYTSGGSVRIFTFGARDGRLRHTARYDLEPSTYFDSDATGACTASLVQFGVDPSCLKRCFLLFMGVLLPSVRRPSS